MKIDIDKLQLALCAQRLHGAVSDRSLAQIGITSPEPDILEMAATDSAIAIFSRVSCSISGSDSFYVPSRLFLEVVRELPNGTVTLENHQNYLVITDSNRNHYRFKIPLIEDLEWRAPPEIKSKFQVNLPSQKLAHSISQVQYCIAQDSPRHYGAVGFLHLVGSNTLRLVGSDGFRLSLCEFPVEISEKVLATGICLSKRALNEIARLASEGYESIGISVSEDGNTMLVEIPQCLLYIRLSSVKYPNYRAVIPDSDQTEVGVSKGHLQSVTKRVLLAADKKTKALQLRFSQSSLTLNAKTMGSSEGTENIPLEGYKGPERELIVNGKYLSDVLSTTNNDMMNVQFSGNEDPVVIVPVEESSGCYSKHVLVPIKDNEV